MQTAIFWEVNTEDTEELIPEDFEEKWSLPEGIFECDRLNKDDVILLEMILDDGGMQEYDVRVNRVVIGMEYPLADMEQSPDIVQWVYVKG